MRIGHVFVYGTLLPGDVRFPLMQQFVVDDGWPDSIAGRLYDTGQDYPAAVLDERADPGGRVVGRTFALLDATADQAIERLDEIEGVVHGAYRRVPITTAAGTRAWVYEYGSGLELTPIENGDWLAHRPPDRARPLDSA